MNRRTPLIIDAEAGSTLLLAVLVFAALAILASSIALVSMNDRNLSRYEQQSVEALAAAETGAAYAKRRIRDLTAPWTDENGNGRPDFRLADTLSWGGSYNLMVEATDVKGVGITAYQSNGFSIVSEGKYQGATRRIKSVIVHDSFLKYARFTSNSDLSYACGANISGEVFVNGNLDIPCGCGANMQCKFLEDVSVTGDVPNAACGTFYRSYVTHANPIDLQDSFNWTDVRNKARGLGADNSCAKHGNIGIYMNLPGTDPLHLATQAAPDQNVMILDKFDFCDLATAPPDTCVKYNNVSVINPVTGTALRTHDFNGIVMFEGNGKVRGTADGVSGHCLTIYTANTMYVRNNLITGHTGFDPVTRLPNQSGDPVNIGLVAEGWIYMDVGTPRILRVDAMLLSRTANWGGLGGNNTSDHPVGGPGPLDLDLDGIFGETPHNGDPLPGMGWDEMNINANTWVLNIDGGIVTQGTGSAYPWNDSNVLANATGPTRRYNYDLDLTAYPPPCFPVPLNLYTDVSWTEINDVQSPLTDFLQN